MASHKDLEAIDSVVSSVWVYSPDRLTVASCRSRRPAGRLSLRCSQAFYRFDGLLADFLLA